MASKRKRKHEGTLADGLGVGMPNIVLRVVGCAPERKPYLRLETARGDVATVDNQRSLRSLAHHILRAIGDEP